MYAAPCCVDWLTHVLIRMKCAVLSALVPLAALTPWFRGHAARKPSGRGSQAKNHDHLTPEFPSGDVGTDSRGEVSDLSRKRTEDRSSRLG